MFRKLIEMVLAIKVYFKKVADLKRSLKNKKSCSSNKKDKIYLFHFDERIGRLIWVESASP